MLPLAKIAGRVLVLLAVVGFTLGSVTTPLIPNLAFLIGHFQRNIKLMIGAWGGCAVIANVQDCPHTAFGFTLNLINFPGRTTDGPSPVIAGFTYAMILLPLTAFFALLGVALHTVGTRRGMQLIGAGLTGLALLCGLGGMIFMFIIFSNALRRINGQFDGTPAAFGPAVWMVVVAFVLLLIGTVLLFLSIDRKGQSQVPAGKHYYSMESQSDFNLGKSDTRQEQDDRDAAEYFQTRSEPRVSAQPAAYAVQSYPPQAHQSYAAPHGGFYEEEPAQHYYEAQTSPTEYPAQHQAGVAADFSPSQMYESYQMPQQTQYQYSHRSPASATGSPRSMRKPVVY